MECNLQDKVSPQHHNAHSEKAEAHPQPPSMVDKKSSNIEQEKPSQGKENHYSLIKRVMRSLQPYCPGAQGFFNGVVAISTVLLTVLTCWQYQLQALDQRAWVGVIQQSGPDQVVADTDMVFGVFVRNSGKTPAVNVAYKMTYRGRMKNEVFVPEYNADALQKGVNSTSVIHPDMQLELTTFTLKLTQDLRKELTDGKGVLYIYGQIGYDDIFDYPHCTAFCFFYETDPKKAKVCPTYNYVTDAKCDAD